jgi:pectin methylesterase-like acyl-CoA thioesterase
MLYDSIVAGQTDFLYGFGTLFVDRSTLLMRGCGGGVTAWKGTNTTFANKYGVYISDTAIMATNTTVLEEKRQQCSLGRPWNSMHRSLIMNSYLDEAVLPAGYTIWQGSPNNFNNLTTMALYNMTGPGNDVMAQRESNVTLVWDTEDARPYMRPIDVFMHPHGEQPNIAWIDQVVQIGSAKRVMF